LFYLPKNTNWTLQYNVEQK
jgi:hypothetical protein